MLLGSLMRHLLKDYALRLSDYYIIESVTSCASTLITVCIFFWTREVLGFGNSANLALSAVLGITYVIAARYGGRLADKIGYGRVILLGLVGMAIISSVGWLGTTRWWPHLVIIIFTVCLAPIWPSLEAAILVAPSSQTMSRRLGVYNMVWSITCCVSYFLGGALFLLHPHAIFWVTGFLLFVGIIWLLFRKANGHRNGIGTVEPPQSGTNISEEGKRRFVYMARLANMIAFFLASTLIALAPHLCDHLHISYTQAIWLACTFYFSRIAAFAILNKWTLWHYRMPWIIAAMFLSTFCLVLVFYSTNILVIIGALVAFGLCLGLTYFASIFYSLDYGKMKGEQGGLHEAFIGVGTTIGPVIGSAAFVILRNSNLTELVIIAIALGISLLGSLIIQTRTKIKE